MKLPGGFHIIPPVPSGSEAGGFEAKMNQESEGPRLSNNAERTIAWIEKQGAVVCLDPAEKQRMERYIVPVAELFPDLMKMLCAVYVYRMSEQTGEAAGSDGICWKNVTNYAGTRYAIGISTEALDKGPEYTAFLFMHELAHIKEPEHSYKFHEILSDMIGQYNHAYSVNLANDMAGLPMRSDCRSYDPFAGNVQHISKRPGTTFRTSGKPAGSR